VEAMVHNLVEIDSFASDFLLDNDWSVQMVMAVSIAGIDEILVVVMVLVLNASEV
jgi:hypothetical protein